MRSESRQMVSCLMSGPHEGLIESVLKATISLFWLYM